MVTNGLMYMLILLYLGVYVMMHGNYIYYVELTTYVRACEKSKQVET
jgi:hypothetical protein